jgi:phage gpG-like protein
VRSVLTVDVDSAALRRRIQHALILLGPEGGQGLMRAIGLLMKRSTLDKFKAQGDGESSWAPLADSTIAGRRDVHKAMGTLRRRKTQAGRERASERLGAILGAVKILDDNGELRRSIEVFHQTGTRSMPQREFLTVTGQDRRGVSGLLDKYLQRLL